MDFNQQILNKLDEMDRKLDEYCAQQLKNTKDIEWIKKLGTILVTLTIFLGTQLYFRVTNTVPPKVKHIAFNELFLRNSNMPKYSDLKPESTKETLFIEDEIEENTPSIKEALSGYSKEEIQEYLRKKNKTPEPAVMPTEVVGQY